MSVEQRRELLVQAAWRVLARSGVAAATTRSICAEAGMPQGAFHYCFPRRDDLLREVVSSLLPQEIAAATAAVDRRGSLAGAINRALLAYWELVEADPEAHQVLYEITTTALRTPGMADLAVAQYGHYYVGAEQAIVALGTVRGVHWDVAVPLLARQVVTILDGLTLQYLIDRDGTAARAVLRAFADDLARHGKVHR